MIERLMTALALLGEVAIYALVGLLFVVVVLG